MALTKCICDSCDHSLVCEIYKKKIFIFSDDVKTPLGVDLSVDSCQNFKQIEE